MSRCVYCGRAKDQHVGDAAVCIGATDNPGWTGNEKNRFASMALPEGMTCSECAYLPFCENFIGNVRANTSCDWYPIRFVPKIQTEVTK